jgi:RimJ/RimL family protein N-acetyltransferase
VGRGYATEAARAASIKVLVKIGMEPVGTRRAYGAEHLVYAARTVT